MIDDFRLSGWPRSAFSGVGGRVLMNDRIKQHGEMHALLHKFSSTMKYGMTVDHVLAGFPTLWLYHSAGSLTGALRPWNAFSGENQPKHGTAIQITRQLLVECDRSTLLVDQPRRRL
jgi:hypothetical protein